MKFCDKPKRSNCHPVNLHYLFQGMKLRSRIDDRTLERIHSRRWRTRCNVSHRWRLPWYLSSPCKIRVNRIFYSRQRGSNAKHANETRKRHVARWLSYHSIRFQVACIPRRGGSSYSRLVRASTGRYTPG